MSQAPKDRILLVTPGGSFFTDPFKRAFEHFGYECKVFDHRQGAVFTNKFLRRVLNRFSVLKFIKRWQIKKTNRLLLELVSSYKPRYLFAQKGESIYPETIKEIKKMEVTTINFYNDMMNQWHFISKVAPVYDYFFPVDRVVLRRLRYELGLKNCFYMASATEPMADPFTNRQDMYDVSFIGQYNGGQYSKREKYMKSISDLDLNIWGTKGWTKTPLVKLFHGPSVGDQRFDIYSHSKIVLDTTWDLMPTEFVASRTFEAMGCGAMFMTDYAREGKQTYIEGREIVLFKDEKELREKIMYYLKHDKEREEIAKAGYAKTVAQHTYNERVKQMFNIIENQEPTF